MDRTRVIDLLRLHADTLQQRFGAHPVAIFGSAARDELRPDSDIDILVEFDRPPTFDTYFGAKDYLESILGRDVDLVTDAGLKPRARRHVEQDLVRVA